MTPGPTPAPPEVLAAIAQPVVHHRGPDYKKLYAECLGRLREIFRTGPEVLLFGASGTGAMESAVANLCSRGERVLVVSAGAGPSSPAPTVPTSSTFGTPGARFPLRTTLQRGSGSARRPPSS